MGVSKKEKTNLVATSLLNGFARPICSIGRRLSRIQRIFVVDDDEVTLLNLTPLLRLFSSVVTRAVFRIVDVFLIRLSNSLLIFLIFLGDENLVFFSGLFNGLSGLVHGGFCLPFRLDFAHDLLLHLDPDVSTASLAVRQQCK